jgi:hypothetical protein
MSAVFHVINLDRTPERFVRFCEWNPGFMVARFSAVEGAALNRDECVANNLIRPENGYTPGALGCMISHLTLWQRAISTGQPVHILEDDVILRPDFWIQAEAALARVPGWDVVLWSHSFDWPVMIHPGPGAGPVVLQYNPEIVNAGLDQFRASTVAPTLFRLGSAAALCCYSVSPAGAARMMRDCLPVGNVQPPYVPRPEIGWRNTGIDVETSRHYGNWQAYVAMPPLAVAPNDQTASTLRGHLAVLHDPAIANPLSK